MKIVRFQFHDSYNVDSNVSCRDRKQSFSVNSFVARSSVVASLPQPILSELNRGRATDYSVEVAIAQSPTRREVTLRASQCKAVFCSSTTLQAIGLEGESKAMLILAPIVLSALSVSSMHDVLYECNSTAPVLVGTACMTAQSIAARVPRTLTCGHFGCAVKDVVLGSYFD